MRIVAGEFRGRRLKDPKGRDIRPTADRIREALFSILGAGVQGARVLDLYAGTGALGLEALSRRAASAVFVDSSTSAVRLIRENVDACGASSRARIIGGEAVKIVRRLAVEGETFDLVFMDPPYRKGIDPGLLTVLAEITEENARAVVEHAHEGPTPLAVAPWREVLQRRYGGTIISIFEQVPGAPEDACGDRAD